MAVFLLDLDHFKDVNDTLGHQNGDSLLKEVARRLKGCVREVDTVARMGGDEFVLVITDAVAWGDIASVADRVLKSLRPAVILDDRELHVTTSIGISVYPDDGDNLEVLLKNADLAMYCAKRQNGNTFCRYEPTM